jgi:tRNA-splicing ligase RtcB
MKEVVGKFATAKIFTDNIEEMALTQIQTVCDNIISKDSKIRIMPDVHAGAGCVIGTTMTIGDKIVPNLVGVDIGCGVLTAYIERKNIEFEEIDSIIRKHIPSGFNVRNKVLERAKRFEQEINNCLYCIDDVDVNRAMLSLGTLGGGNHFIEIAKNEEGEMYLLIHTGSRNFGKQIADYYQKKARKNLTSGKSEIIAETIKSLKEQNRESEIQAALKSIKPEPVIEGLEYLEKQDKAKYLNDMRIAQEYANLNRMCIMYEICHRAEIDILFSFDTVHNYIDLISGILRKGAVSAIKNQKILIPINMKDGSLICIGKGNEDWNYSAPHGAGRLMSRKKAKENISLDNFKTQMKDVWSTTVGESTLDEAPDAYKPIEEIIENIKDTVEITRRLFPVYNYKASDEQ